MGVVGVSSLTSVLMGVAGFELVTAVGDSVSMGETRLSVLMGVVVGEILGVETVGDSIPESFKFSDGVTLGESIKVSEGFLGVVGVSVGESISLLEGSSGVVGLSVEESN